MDELTSDRIDHVQMYLSTMSDDDLLLELRRRGRLGRLVNEVDAPMTHVQHGYPLDIQIKETFKGLLRGLMDLPEPDQRIPGFKVSTVVNRDLYGSDLCRRVFIPLNIVLNKARG